MVAGFDREMLWRTHVPSSRPEHMRTSSLDREGRSITLVCACVYMVAEERERLKYAFDEEIRDEG